MTAIDLDYHELLDSLGGLEAARRAALAPEARAADDYGREVRRCMWDAASRGAEDRAAAEEDRASRRVEFPKRTPISPA